MGDSLGVEFIFIYLFCITWILKSEHLQTEITVKIFLIVIAGGTDKCLRCQ